VITGLAKIIPATALPGLGDGLLETLDDGLTDAEGETEADGLGLTDGETDELPPPAPSINSNTMMPGTDAPVTFSVRLPVPGAPFESIWP
jgi:hypothetical protein